MNVAVTMGAVGVGIGLLLYHLVLWWPGLKTLQTNPTGAVTGLLPLVLGWCFGALLTLCAGGIIGWAVDATLWLGSWSGDVALSWGVGGQAGDDVSRRGPVQVLTNGGHLMVLLGLFVWAGAMRKLSGSRRKALVHGALSGVLLAMTGGIFGHAAGPLAAGMNVAGAWFSTGTLG